MVYPEPCKELRRRLSATISGWDCLPSFIDPRVLSTWLISSHSERTLLGRPAESPRVELASWPFPEQTVWRSSQLEKLPTPKRGHAWLTLEGEQNKNVSAVKRGFQPLNHHKQKCKRCFPTTTKHGSSSLCDADLGGHNTSWLFFFCEHDVRTRKVRSPGSMCHIQTNIAQQCVVQTVFPIIRTKHGVAELGRSNPGKPFNWDLQ